MRVRIGPKTRSSLLAAALLAPLPACAEGIEVAPVLIELAHEQRTAVLNVTNHGQKPVVVQTRPFAWSQEDGADKLVATQALAVSPPFVEIAPAQSQIVRLVLRQPAAANETSYRLLLDEIPPPATGSAIRFALRMSVPVFAEPDRAAAATLEWRVLLRPGGPVLSVQNRGQRHERFQRVDLFSGQISLPVRTASHRYVLAGGQIEWPIEDRGRLQPGGTARVRASFDTGPLDAIVPITRP